MLGTIAVASGATGFTAHARPPLASPGPAVQPPPRTDPTAPRAATLPNGSAPPGERPSLGDHGNGSLAIKWPWWWRAYGQLVVEGRRLDAPAPPLRAEAPGGRRLDRPPPSSGAFRVTDPSRDGFLGSSLIFPTPGCWEVTATVGEARPALVTLVVASGTAEPEPTVGASLRRTSARPASGRPLDSPMQSTGLP